jgi:hypothetical protein
MNQIFHPRKIKPIERFNQEIDRMLVGHPANTDLSAADQEALAYAQTLARVNYSVESSAHQRIRQRLVQQAQHLQNSAPRGTYSSNLRLAVGPGLALLLMGVAGWLLSLAIFMPASAHSQTSDGSGHPVSTAYAAPRLSSSSSSPLQGMLPDPYLAISTSPYQPQSQQTPASSLLTAIPKPIPTPMAPPPVASLASETTSSSPRNSITP